MSWAATAWVKRMRLSPVTGEPISKVEKLVLFVLADYHNEERGDAWASLRFLAQESLCTRSGVVRTLRRLEEKQVLEIVRDAAASVTRVTNRYRFIGLDIQIPDREYACDHASSPPVDNGASDPMDLGVPSDPRSPGLVTPGHQASDPRSPGLVTPGHHIFPKNLSNQSFQKHIGGVVASGEEVITELNARTGRQYLARHPDGQPTANLQYVTSLLRKGYTEAQLLAVVEDRVKRWQADPERREYLRPETLFRPGKFAQYLGQVGPPARAPTPKALQPVPRVERQAAVAPPMDFREMIEMAKQQTAG